jgi:hypothetical protein
MEEEKKVAGKLEKLIGLERTKFSKFPSLFLFKFFKHNATPFICNVVKIYRALNSISTLLIYFFPLILQFYSDSNVLLFNIREAAVT